MQPNVDESMQSVLNLVPLFVRASEDAYSVFHNARAGLDQPTLKEYQRKLIALGVHAERTSQATENLRSDGFWLQSLALLRVRLEETIVSSYLIHQNSENLFRRYFEFGPIAEYRQAKAVTAHPQLAEHVSDRLDLNSLAAQAADVERSFNPGFDITNGKFAAKWTDLDLRSMAAKRDELAAETGLTPSLVPLTPLYIGFYKTASAVVHADASVISSPFVGTITGADGVQRDAQLFWDISIPVILSTCDIVQCYEILAACGSKCEDQFLAIVARLA